MTAQSIVLQPTATLDIKDGLGLQIEALCGAVWITQTGDHQRRHLGPWRELHTQPQRS